jgi:hypothetical protein
VAVKAPDGSIDQSLPIPGKYISTPVPPEGLFTSTVPKPNATDAGPDLVQIVHVDGVNPWDQSKVTLRLDNAAVTATVTKTGSELTVKYVPSPLLAPKSTHTATLVFPDAGGNPQTYQWQFTTASFSKDTLHSYVGLLKGAAAYTPDKGGHSGKAGDYAIDLGTAGGAWVDIAKGGFLNAATTNDELTFAIWVKKYDIANGSAFWAIDSSAGRGFQAHTPWSDDSIYFDTMGCCAADTQRINASITTFAGYTGTDDWWTNWHHFVFTKKADQKNIFIDGQLFLNGSSTAPLLGDFTEIALGTDGNPGGDYMHGLIDDFAVFSNALAIADAAALFGGKAPTDLASSKLIAYWNFDDAVPAVSTTAPTLSAARASTGLSITFTGKLLSATAVTGPWTAVAGAASPYAVTAAPGQTFYKASN